MFSLCCVSPGSFLLLLVPPPTSSLCFLPFQRQDGEDLVVKGVEEEVTPEAFSPVADPPIACLLGDVVCSALPQKTARRKNTVSKADGVLSFLSKVQNVQKKKHLKMEYVFAGKKTCVAPI